MRSAIESFSAAGLLVVSLAAIQVSYGDSHSTEAQRLGEKVRSAPINVIFDTDMWSDIDDALALAMLHALHDRHEANLVAVTVSTDNKWSAPYVDLVDTFYGHAWIPVGAVRHGVDARAFAAKMPGVQVTNFTELLSNRRQADGSLVYPHRLLDGSKAPEAVRLLRRTLAAQPDGSVVVIQVGFSTNLARLLESPADAASALPGYQLIQKKVRLLSVMAGSFGETQFAGKAMPKGTPEFNLMMDVPSAQKVFSGWPTPIIVSGNEIGAQMLFPATSVEHDFTYVAHHPIVETYRSYSIEGTFTVGLEKHSFSVKWPHDHPTYDLTAVLYGVRPEGDYFALSAPGKITVLPDGRSRFEESGQGNQRYLILKDEQKARVLEAMVLLASQPPRGK